MSQSSSFPAVIAHRGGSKYAPENTLAAFQYAVDQGADGIELDVHLSADGEVVVIHDAALDRTTNGSGFVHEKTLAELKELDAGSWFGAEFAGQQLPTLTEVFELVGDKLLINVELKGPGLFKSALPEKVVEIVKRFSFTDRVIFSSFKSWLLRMTGQLLPDARLGLLLMPGTLAKIARVLSRPVINPWAFHPYYRSVTPRFVSCAAKQNRQVLAYTVNDPDEIKRLTQMGIYGIITDDPALALAIKTEYLQ